MLSSVRGGTTDIDQWRRPSMLASVPGVSYLMLAFTPAPMIVTVAADTFIFGVSRGWGWLRGDM